MDHVHFHLPHVAMEQRITRTVLAVHQVRFYQTINVSCNRTTVRMEQQTIHHVMCVHQDSRIQMATAKMSNTHGMQVHLGHVVLHVDEVAKHVL